MLCLVFVKHHLLLLFISAMKLFFLATLLNGLLLLSLVDDSSGRQIENQVGTRKNDGNAKMPQPPTTTLTKSSTQSPNQSLTKSLTPMSTPVPVPALVTSAFNEKGKASGFNFLNVHTNGEKYISFILIYFDSGGSYLSLDYALLHSSISLVSKKDFFSLMALIHFSSQSLLAQLSQCQNSENLLKIVFHMIS